jgi:hypothetical protein
VPRGQHEKDERLFADDVLPTLRRAVEELSWLLGRGYAEKSALALVGDRYQLRSRQRLAVWRCACGDAEARDRLARRLAPPALRGEGVAIDGFNVLITTEAALSGGIVLIGNDGWTRDIASIHGSYRRVEQTPRAIELLGAVLADAGVASARWLLDRPVSNSGRLAELLRAHAEQNELAWTVELVDDPDGVLAETEAVAATSDGWILDRARRSCDLPGEAIARGIPDAHLLDLREPYAG